MLSDLRFQIRVREKAMKIIRRMNDADPSNPGFPFQLGREISLRKALRRERAVGLSLLIAALGVIFWLFLVAPGAQGQTTGSSQGPRRDEQALTLLNRVLDAAGWHSGTAPGDFTASGTITYFEANAALSGSATVRGRGARQFRMDAMLDEGRRSIILDNASWTLQEGSSRSGNVSHLDVGGLGILTLPYPSIAEALNDPTTWITYAGSAEASGHPVEEVHVWHRVLYQVDQLHIKVRPAAADYFIDSQTGLIVRMADATHPSDPARQEPLHGLDFGDYTTIGGIAVPMLVTERSVGENVWQLHLNSFKFNSGLTGSEFGADWQGAFGNEK